MFGCSASVGRKNVIWSARPTTSEAMNIATLAPINSLSVSDRGPGPNETDDPYPGELRRIRLRIVSRGFPPPASGAAADDTATKLSQRVVRFLNPEPR